MTVYIDRVFLLNLAVDYTEIGKFVQGIYQKI